MTKAKGHMEIELEYWGARIAKITEGLDMKKTATDYVNYQQPVCACYVAKLPAHIAYGLRYGAHAEMCPCYKRSCDPVDVYQDTKDREHYQNGL